MSTHAAQQVRAGELDPELVVRYSLGERVNHWIGALTYIYCMATGLAFWSPYLFWLAVVVGGGTVARAWHPWIGLIFTVSFLWIFWDWRHDMQVDADDRAWGKAIPDYIENRDENLPPQGRFNYGQKLFFWAMFYCTILLLLSGIVLWYTQSIPWSLRYLRYFGVLIHASVAMITIGLFLIHVYMSTVLEKGSFGSMIHGTVTRAWAWTFHRKWYEQVEGGRAPKR